MKRLITILIICSLCSVHVFSQSNKDASALKPLSQKELDKLKEIPPIPLPADYGDPVLPFSVDNSLLPYFRPLFSQAGLECGQASSIGLGLTYELNCTRNLPGNVPANQQATHFTYDFINDGSDCGVSFFETWQIIKHCGNPSVADYGGLSYGGPSRWMSGYDLYYNAMHNRISGFYSIDVSTPEGLNIFKGWIYNHLNGSAHGGVAQMYISYNNPSNTLPAGTPEAGKAVILAFTGSPNHGLTIVGYNDSIRWDFNNDGQYTNNLDTNGDGIVDMKDWEIGGYKVANTYGGINSWGDQGFSYVMYRTFAESLSEGGIWNNSVYAAFAKTDQTPQLTIKAKISYNKRNKIKVIPGISLDLNATEPDYTLDLPIFDFQGGDLYMQGGTSSADKELEFGLDISPLLSEFPSGSTAKVFLQVAEYDPNSQGSGEIMNFSVMDYTGTSVVEVPCLQTNVAIINNSTTTLSVTLPLTFQKAVILTDSLPKANLYEPYSYTLTSSEGRPPMTWKINKLYQEKDSTATFPLVSAHQLNLSGNAQSVEQPLEFSFPFYGKTYNKVYVHTDGYLLFEYEDFPWTFVISYNTYMKNIKAIAPLSMKTLTIETGDGVWYEGNENYATFRWKASLWEDPSGTELNFAVRIYPSGKIEYYYSNISSVYYLKWYSGISEGNDDNYILNSNYGDHSPQSGSVKIFNPELLPIEMDLNNDGVFSGTPMQVYSNCNIKFVVEDNNNVRTTKILPFTTKGLGISYAINSGGDNIIEYGENANMSITLNNTNTSAFNGTNMWIECQDPYITLTDSTETIGNIPPGEQFNFENSFAFDVAGNIADNHSFTVKLFIASLSDTTTREIQLTGFAPKLSIANVAIMDGANGSLDPGETADLLVRVQNTGGAKATGLDALLESIDPGIIINSAHYQSDTLNANQTDTLVFNVTASASLAIGHVIPFTVSVNADYNYSVIDTINVIVGIIAENYESGNFTSYDWQFDGNSDWVITDQLPYEGLYSAKSGVITDNQESIMYLNLKVLTDGEISFYKKVSCENDQNGTNYDWLGFYIDNTLQNKWDGEINWSREVFPVTAGEHIFKWTYHKDYSASSGSDAVWIDYIVFPAIDNGIPNMVINPLLIEKTMNISETDIDTLQISNLGGGFINYNILIPAEWLSADPTSGQIGSMHTTNINLIYNTHSLGVGIYSDTITVNDQLAHTVKIPVTINVLDPNDIGEINSINSAMTIYPNPGNGMFTLNIFNESPAKYSLEIFNTIGNLLYKSEGNLPSEKQAIHLNLTQLQEGVYYCKLSFPNQILTRKLIITK